MKLRKYQKDISNQLSKLVNQLGFCYLSAEVRTGKTLMVLEACNLLKCNRVLFITKKKAFDSIRDDFNAMGYGYDLTIINKESIHKIESNDFDLVVCDEAHGLFGTFPKPNNFTKAYKKRFGKLPCIMLSGTASPESFSQLFHQFWVCNKAPFSHYLNFYKWAKEFVRIHEVNYGYGMIKDYSNANYDIIKPLIEPYLIKFTQEEAGFSSKITEHFINVKMEKNTYEMADKLKKDLVLEGKHDTVIADTPAKLSQKLHQIYSGTIKLDSGKRLALDLSKAKAIKDKFSKIAIFYKFKAELDALKEVYGNNLTEKVQEFNTTDKVIALQVVSGREGINLSKAEALVFYNIDFSATSYWQARDRMTTKERTENNVYWVFSEGGMEHDIYKAVVKKKNFTTTIFKKWLQNSSQK